jgi:hypothetical protein
MKKLISLSNSTTGKFFIFLIAICIVTNANGQQKDINDSTKLKPRIYKANLLTYNSKEYIRGYLANLSDSVMYLSQSPLLFGSGKPDDHLSDYSYNNLEKVVIQRKGSVGRGAWKGALIGLGAGVITGFVLGNDPPVTPPSGSYELVQGLAVAVGYALAEEFRTTAFQKAIFLGVAGAGTGCLIGVIVGGITHKKFLIGRNQQKYGSMRESIFKKLFRKHSLSRNYEPAYTPNL